MKDLVHIGYTSKSHGLKGEIKLKVKDAFLDDLPVLDVIFLKKGSATVPYFLESLREGNSIIAKFEDINDRNQAEAISSKEIFARKADLKIIDGENLELRHLQYGTLINFKIIDEYLGTLGTIKNIIEYPQQEMAVFDFQTREQLLPLNDFFIQKIDKPNQALYVSLPDGMFDL